MGGSGAEPGRRLPGLPAPRSPATIIDCSCPPGGGPARLLDMVQGRSGTVVSDWLDERGQDWCARVDVAALDPFRGYERAVRAGLPPPPSS